MHAAVHTEITASQSVGGSMRALKQGRVHEAAGVSENKRVSDWHAKASCPPADVGMGMRGAKPDHSRTLREADSQAACPTLAEQVTPHSFNCQTPAVCAQSTQSRSRKPAEPPTSLTHSLSLSLSLALLLSPRMKAFLSCELSLSLSGRSASMPACSCNPSRPNPVPSDAPPPFLFLFFFFSFPFHSLYPNIQCHPVAPALTMPVPRNGREGARVHALFRPFHAINTGRSLGSPLSLSLPPFFLGSAISTH